MARLFDATTEKLTQSSPPDPPTAGTVMFWWKPAFGPGGSATFRLWEYGKSGGELTVQRFSNNNWFCGWNGFGGDDRIVVSDTGTFTSGVWASIALRWDAARSPHSEFLIGASSTGTKTGTLDTGGTFSQLTIGNSFFANNAVAPGTISDVALYDTWLPDWGLDAFDAGLSPLCILPGNLARYDRLTGAGSAEKDSISGQTLTVTGATQAESPLVSLGSPTFVTREAAAVGGTHPVNPFGHPFHGPFAGPIGI